MHLDDVDLMTGNMDGPPRMSFTPCKYCKSLRLRTWQTWESFRTRQVLTLQVCGVCQKQWREEVISPEGYSCP